MIIFKHRESATPRLVGMADDEENWRDGTLCWERYELPTGPDKGKMECAPEPCFLHTATQAGSKLVVYGGSGYFGDPLSQLLVFDTERMAWSMPTEKPYSRSLRPISLLHVSILPATWCAVQL